MKTLTKICLWGCSFLSAIYGIGTIHTANTGGQFLIGLIISITSCYSMFSLIYDLFDS